MNDESDIPVDVPAPLPPVELRDPALVERFVQLFAANHRRLFAYIMVLTHDRNAAEEVFQEMSLVLWREFHNYRVDGDFVAWANAMSLNQVRKFRRTQKRFRQVFNDELLDQIAGAAAEQDAEMDPRRAALRVCLAEISPRTRKVIDLYYGTKTTADEVAKQLGRSVHTVYKTLKLTRKALLECIRRRMTSQT